MKNIAADKHMRENSLLTVSDLANLLQVSNKVVYSLNHRRSGPAPIKIGKSLRYRRETVEKWLLDKENAAWHL